MKRLIQNDISLIKNCAILRQKNKKRYRKRKFLLFSKLNVREKMQNELHIEYLLNITCSAKLAINCLLSGSQDKSLESGRAVSELSPTM